MQNCEFNPLLHRYYDGALAGAEHRQIEAHLRDCPQCAAELEQLRAMSLALRTGVAEATPKALPIFVARLEALASNVERQPVLRFVTRLTAAAAAILIAASVQWAIHRPAAPQMPGAPTALNSEERGVLDPDAAVASLAPDSVVANDPRFELISQDVSGGRQ